MKSAYIQSINLFSVRVGFLICMVIFLWLTQCSASRGADGGSDQLTEAPTINWVPVGHGQVGEQAAFLNGLHIGSFAGGVWRGRDPATGRWFPPVRLAAPLIATPPAPTTPQQVAPAMWWPVRASPDNRPPSVAADCPT